MTTTPATTKGLVLVTGANGYVAQQTVLSLLSAGYSVRGTVRNLSSAAPLIAALPPSLSRNFSVVSVPDITVPHAFDSAVQGVDAIAHLAAAVSNTFDDPEPVIKLSVDSLLRALEAAETEKQVKKFVFMSSVAAIKPSGEDEWDLDETKWNDRSLEMVEELGRKTPGFVIYGASKTAAEKKLWEWVRENKPSFGVTSLNPCFIVGPPVAPATSPASINFTTKFIYDVLSGSAKDISQPTTIPGAFPGYVDIRDVGRMVVFSVDHPDKTDGDRFLLASAYSPLQAVADIIRDKFPEFRDRVPEGQKGNGYKAGYEYPEKQRYNGRKAAERTGVEYIDWEKTVVDTVEAFKGLLE